MIKIIMTFFVQDWVVKDVPCYLRNEQLKLLRFISKVRCCSIYIHDVYVNPSCNYGILFDGMHPDIVFTF